MHGFHGALATRLQVVETERAGFADQAVNGQPPLRRVDAGNTEMSKNEDVLACGDGVAHLVRAQFDAAQSARRIHRRPGRAGYGDLLVRHRGCTPPALSVVGLLQAMACSVRIATALRPWKAARPRTCSQNWRPKPAGGMPTGSGQFLRSRLARDVHDLLPRMRAPALDTMARSYSVCGGASTAQLGSAPNG